MYTGPCEVCHEGVLDGPEAAWLPGVRGRVDDPAGGGRGVRREPLLRRQAGAAEAGAGDGRGQAPRRQPPAGAWAAGAGGPAAAGAGAAGRDAGGVAGPAQGAARGGGGRADAVAGAGPGAAAPAAQKKSVHPSQRHTPRVRAMRGAYARALRRVPRGRRVYVDETGATIAMTRPYGRAPPGERVSATVPHARWES